MTAETCENCRYLRAGYACRRYPPSPLLQPLPNGNKALIYAVTAAWPIVDRNAWCGEWKERPRET